MIENTDDEQIERLNSRIVELLKRAERLRLELEKIGWMDEFLDAAGAKAMMEIARDAVNEDERLTNPFPSSIGTER